MANAQEDQIENIFNSFDKDKSGTIELNELKDVAAALGETLPQDQLNEIVKKLDTNGDGKISLDEFKFWWSNGLKGKLGELVFLKAKSMQMTDNFMNQFKKAGVDLSKFDKNEGLDLFSVGVSLGEKVEGCMKISASAYHRGDRFKWAFKELQ